MFRRSIQGVEFWALNTDAQALENSLAPNKVQLGGDLTRGLGKNVSIASWNVLAWKLPNLNGCLPFTGTGGRPELGEQAAQESVEALAGTVTNADMVRVRCRLSQTQDIM